MISTKEEHIQFLEENLLKNVRTVIDNNLMVFSFILMAQGIEIMGAYLDSKPMRSVRQSAARFNIALFKLFPKEYSKNNSKGFLYKQLRSNLLHMYIPATSIELRKGLSGNDKLHLKIENDSVILYVEDLYKDYSQAVYCLIGWISNNELCLKKISSGNLRM